VTTKKKTSFGLEENGLCYLVLFEFDSYYVGIEKEHAFKYWCGKIKLKKISFKV
jgi:hypothetical protein